jgi:glucan phosphoethanolaminetransferase (alkaline phosphatase superfamily)
MAFDSCGTVLDRMAYFSSVEPTHRASRPHIATWIVACLAGAFSTVAALAYLFYMANGIVVGAIIGLPGRETDVALAQHYASVWLVVCAVFQFGVAIALFSLLRIGAEADRLVRLVSRGVVATFLSFVATLVVGEIIFEMLNLLRPHLR